MTRFEPFRWLRNAENLAGLEPQEGRVWDAFRPAWATVAMVTDIYQQADQETTLKVVLGAAEIREVQGR